MGDAHGEGDVEDVVGVEAVVVHSVAVAGRSDVVNAADDSFGEEEAVREFDIVAWGAHGDRERGASDTDFEWFLDDECVGPSCGVRSTHAHDGATSSDASHQGRCSSRIRMALLTGVLDLCATWSRGMRGLVSG